MKHVEPPVDEHPVDKAARLYGGRPELAAALKVTVAALGNWKVRGVPIEQCVPLERALGGAVTRRDLRPADWQDIWPELAPANRDQPAIESEPLPTRVQPGIKAA